MRAARFLRLFTALGVSLVGFAACEIDAPGIEGSRDFEQEPTGETSSELVSYSCATHTDTGYSNGSPFAITVMTVDGKPVEQGTANAFLTMAKAAEGAGIQLRINSGFRTNDEQKYLYNCYLTGKCNSGNLAAKPGYSNHQSGHALDLNTGGGALGWLNAHGGGYGFKRTVPSENWHWEWWGGGPVQDFCPRCKDECQGNVLARANCEKVDCGAQGAFCQHDGGGLRCACKEECQGNVLVGSGCQRTDCASKGAACVQSGGLRCDALPRGSLDVADGTSIGGWAQDPSIAEQAIEAHIYFGGPAGAANVVGRSIKADDPRADLCSAIGSCNHAFTLRTPRSLLDGAPHAVHAYGIDGSGAPNAQLGNSPRTLLQATPDLPVGALLRRVPSDAVFETWRFSAFDDVAPMPDGSAKVGAWRDTDAPPLPTAPELVQGDDATGSIWLLDSGVRRRVSSPAEWRFGEPKTLRAAELYAIPQGAPLPERPLLVRDSGPVDYVLDVPFLPIAGGADPAGGGEDPLGGGEGGTTAARPGGSAGSSGSPTTLSPAATDGAGSEGSCAVRPSATGGSGFVASLVGALVLGSRRRRRRS